MRVHGCCGRPCDTREGRGGSKQAISLACAHDAVILDAAYFEYSILNLDHEREMPNHEGSREKFVVVIEDFKCCIKPHFSSYM